jgi:hypothetical protein
MKTLSVRTISGLGLLLAFVQVSADSPHPSADERAIAACAQALLAKIKPDSHIGVRSRNAGDSQTFFGSIGGSPLAPYKLMELEMTVTTGTDTKPLATSICSVDRSASVRSLYIKIQDPQGLVRLQAHELQLAALLR